MTDKKDSRAMSMPPAPAIVMQEKLAELGCTWDPDRDELCAPKGKYFLHPECQDTFNDGRYSSIFFLKGPDEYFEDEDSRITGILEILSHGFTDDSGRED